MSPERSHLAKRHEPGEVLSRPAGPNGNRVHDGEATGSAPGLPVRTTEGSEQSLLRLQRLAGNASVAALMRDSTAVQREATDDAEEESSETYSAVPDPDVPNLMDVEKTTRTAGNTTSSSTSYGGITNIKSRSDRPAAAAPTGPPSAGGSQTTQDMVVSSSGDARVDQADNVRDELQGAIDNLSGDPPNYTEAYRSLSQGNQEARELRNQVKSDPASHDLATMILGTTVIVSDDVGIKAGYKIKATDVQDALQLEHARLGAEELANRLRQPGSH